MGNWTNCNKAPFVCNGINNSKLHERASEDYYATEPKATRWLLKLENLHDAPILEPACGEGHMAKILLDAGLQVTSRDLIDRGFGEVADFLSEDNSQWNGHIVTNPPYKYATEFVEKALRIIPDGKKVCMFLKLTFLETKRRRELFRRFPPRRVWVSSSRLVCGKNGDFSAVIGNAVAYAWFVWEKGYDGETTLKWFN